MTEQINPLRTRAPRPLSEEQTVLLETAGIRRGSYRFVPHDALRRTIARRMADSSRDAPHFPLTMDVTLDRLLEMRQQRNLNEAPKLSVNDLIVRTAALAIAQTPEVNVSFTPEGLVFHEHADIAVVVAIDGGLITPIVRHAETKSARGIAVELADLAARGRTRRLLPDEYAGGTFSISNLGMFGVRSFGSILNPPQSCILSVGAGEDRVVARDKRQVIEAQMTVTLTCDHRSVDGASGARFLKTFKDLIEAADVVFD
jgi:pyruvate dehydrogenase E2 component (dihydrolipoamide acetyltransferase)